MKNICFYFQVHQPHRLRNYTFFDIGESHHYYDDPENGKILRKVAEKCYLPTNRLMLELIEQFQGKFRIAYSISGTAIEQFKLYSPETMDSFKALAKTGCVEFINETYYHSLSFLYSRDEFVRQVKMHQKLLLDEFGVVPTTFRNTELIYNNELAVAVEAMGFKTILTEGADKILDWRSPNYVYRPEGTKSLKLLLKNYKLSDDVAFRFSDKQWSEHPLSSEKFAYWLHSASYVGDVINLFMDYETFGEHQWKETGIFDFLKALPGQVLQHHDVTFATPSEVSDRLPVRSSLNVPYFISWADTERDLSAWMGNNMQRDALEYVFSLENKVYQSENSHLVGAWRSLQTSDHFYYMCTKWFSDGDVHKYFNPYGSPYDAYANYINVVKDLEFNLAG